MSIAISIVIDGKTIHGTITHRSHSDLTVAITQPVAGFRCSAPHIPYFARKFKDYRTMIGDTLAAELLTQLYHATTELLKNQKLLRNELHKSNGLQPILQTATEKSVSLKQQKRLTKKQLKEGTLSQKEHQQQLKELRQKGDQLQSNISTLKEQFMEQYLTDHKKLLDVDDVLKWLNTAPAS